MARPIRAPRLEGDVPQCPGCGRRLGVPGGEPVLCGPCRTRPLHDPLFRNAMQLIDRVALGEVTSAEAMSALVKRADKLGRPRSDVALYVARFRQVAPAAAEPTPAVWHPPDAA